MFIGSLHNDVIWNKYKNGIYAARYKNYIVVIEQIKDKSLELKNWWYTFIVDPKTKQTISELEAYSSLKEAKKSMKSNFSDWEKYN